MSEKKTAEKTEKSEFDANPVLAPFKGCPELDSVTLLEGIVTNGQSTKRSQGIARGPKSRLFLRKVEGIPFVVHVDPLAMRGMPTHTPLTNVAGVVFRADRLAQEALVAKAEEEAKAAVEAQKAEQRRIVAESEARKAALREGNQEA